MIILNPPPPLLPLPSPPPPPHSCGNNACSSSSSNKSNGDIKNTSQNNKSDSIDTGTQQNNQGQKASTSFYDYGNPTAADGHHRPVVSDYYAPSKPNLDQPPSSFLHRFDQGFPGNLTPSEVAHVYGHVYKHAHGLYGDWIHR